MQLLIFRNEDYKVSQRQHMHALFHFLGGWYIAAHAPSATPTPARFCVHVGLRNLTEAEFSMVMSMPVRNKNSDKYPHMREDTRQLLATFYEPFNKKLASLLHDGRYAWADGLL